MVTIFSMEKLGREEFVMMFVLVMVLTDVVMNAYQRICQTFLAMVHVSTSIKIETPQINSHLVEDTVSTRMNSTILANTKIL